MHTRVLKPNQLRPKQNLRRLPLLRLQLHGLPIRQNELRLLNVDLVASGGRSRIVESSVIPILVLVHRLDVAVALFDTAHDFELGCGVEAVACTSE